MDFSWAKSDRQPQLHLPVPHDIMFLVYILGV